MGNGVRSARSTASGQPSRRSRAGAAASVTGATSEAVSAKSPRKKRGKSPVADPIASSAEVLAMLESTVYEAGRTFPGVQVMQLKETSGRFLIYLPVGVGVCAKCNHWREIASSGYCAGCTAVTP